MSSKSNHLGTMPMLSAKSALKSFAHKADDTDKTPDNKSFSPMASARSILPNEKTFDATVLNDFSKKVDDALEKMFTKTQRFCTKLSRGISRIAKAYFRILLACAIVTLVMVSCLTWSMPILQSWETCLQLQVFSSPLRFWLVTPVSFCT